MLSRTSTWAARRRAARMGRAAREIVLERYTWQAVAERCLAAYELALPVRQTPATL